MKCSVILDNGTKDGRFLSDGELNFADRGFAISYGIDGDKCLFTYENGRVVQERKGSVHIVMKFIEGQETDCVLGTGDGEGSFPLYTHIIKVDRDDKSVCVKLSYTCAGENINLELTAKAKEQK